MNSDLKKESTVYLMKELGRITDLIDTASESQRSIKHELRLREFGVNIGDKIQFVENIGWRTQKVTGIIYGFDRYNYIMVRLFKKDGSAGKRLATLYYSDKGKIKILKRSTK